MALQPQNIPISFDQGLDSKTDPKQVLPGKMLSLNNATFNSPKEIKKRDGNIALPSAIQGGGSISAGVGVASFKNELITLDGTSLYAYSQDLGTNINRGPMVPVDLSVSPVVRNTYNQDQPDSGYHAAAGLKCFAWIDSSGGIKYSVLDSTTGTLIVNNASVIVGAVVNIRAPKVLVVGNYFIITYYDSSVTQLVYKSISVSTPTILSSAVTIATNASGTLPCFDATLINGSMYVAYRVSTGSIGFNSLSTSLILSSQYLVVLAGTINDICIQGDASFNAWCFYGTILGGGTTNGFIVNSALSLTLLARVQLDTIGAVNITANVVGSTATIYYETPASGATGSANDTSHMIKTVTLTYSGTAGTPGVLMRGVGLASKVFQFSGVNYVLVVYAGEYLPNSTSVSGLTTQEPTYFLISGSGNIVMKLAPSNAGLYYGYQLLPEVTQYSSTNFSFPYLYQDDISVQSGVVFFNTGVQEAKINFSIARAVSKLNIANNLLLASGQMWSYDGSNIVEQGFHLYPENLSVIIGTSGGLGSSLNTGTSVNQVQYVAIYEWVDNQGQLNRSAGSIPLTVNLPLASTLSAITFTGNSTINSNVITSVSTFNFALLFVGQVISDTTTAGNFVAGTTITRIDVANATIYLSNNATGTHSGDTYSTKDVVSVGVQIPTLRQTAKQNVSIALYRTENNQTIFYRVSSLTNISYNSFTQDYISITDNLPDSAIIGNEQLYTTGGEVDNISPPACSAIISFKNRALYISPENPFEWGYSKQAIQGSPVEFSSLLFNSNVDQRIGTLAAIGTIDEKTILFGPTSKFYVVGDGPTPSGTNNNFTEAVRLPGTTGCTNQNSILELPVGLVYQDPLKGIWLLDRGFHEQYIGADVSQYNNILVTSAQLFENLNRAIFTLSNGVNLVYDYYVGQWSTDVYALGAVDSTIYQQDLCYIQSNGLNFQQTPGVFSDNGALIPLSFKTGWISFAGIEGFQRLWELQILGTYKSPHTLTVNLYYDYSTAAAQTVVIPVLTDPVLYQYRIHVKQQKCEAVQVEIIESQSGTIGEGLSLSSLGFRVGVKAGLYKNLPAGKSY